MRVTTRIARLILVIGVTLSMLVLAGAPASAAERRSGDQVVVASDEVITDDLYVAATTITIDGTIKGDVIAAGSTIMINGTVEGDVLAVGQTIELNGTLRDDVRVAGTTLRFGSRARIADDVTAAGATVEQQSGATIDGDAYLAGSQGLLAGTIGGELQGAFASLELRGTVARDANLAVGADSDTPTFVFGATALPIRSGFTIADGAQIGGKLTYSAPQQGMIAQNAQIANGVAYTPTPADQQAEPANLWWLGLIRRFVVLLLIGLLLLWLMPTWIARLAEPIRARPLPTLGWGLITLIGVIALLIIVPLTAILLMIFFGALTLDGLAGITFALATATVSGLITGFAVLVSYIAQIVVSMVVGRELLVRIQPRWVEHRIVPLAFGLLLYVLLRAVPGLGPVIAVIVTLLGLGAVWQWGRTRFSGQRMQPAPVAPLAPAPGV